MPSQEIHLLSKKFPKEIRLTSKKEIEIIFKQKLNFFSFPYKIFYNFGDLVSDQKLKILITVPKKQFKKAVDRNRLKRLFREVFRKNKHILKLSTGNKPVHIAFLYIHSEILSFDEMEKKMILAIHKINNQIIVK